MTEARKKVPTKAELEKENKELRATLEKQGAALTATAGQLNQERMNHAPNIPTYGSTSPMVGIRNVSDNTVGVPINIPGEPQVTLNAALGGHDPNSVAVISYAAWLQVRGSKLISKGLVVRDDAVLGEQFAAAPSDRPEQLPVAAELPITLSCITAPPFIAP